MQDDSLVPREVADGLLRIPLGQVQAVRVERPIVVDPDGYLVEVGVRPESERWTGVMWLLVLGIAVANLGAAVLALRRRA